MKIIKIILWLSLIIFTIYIVLIFIKPVLSSIIADKLWLTYFNQQVEKIKQKVEGLSTKIPTQEELINIYSWAVNKAELLKGNITNIRETTENLGQKYNEAKNFVNETWVQISEVKNSLDWIWGNINNITNIKDVQ